jgi:hypothetical protein
MKNTYKILVGKPEGKRPIGRPRRRRENNIIMDLKGIFGTGQIPVAGSCEHVNEPSDSTKAENFLTK